MRAFLVLYLIFGSFILNSQNICGIVSFSNNPIKNALVVIENSKKHIVTDSTGRFCIVSPSSECLLQIRYPGCITYMQKLHLSKDTFIIISLQPDTSYFDEITVTDTRLLVSKKTDAFNTEIYDHCTIASSSAMNLFEGVQNINGLRPQLNCNICNTGDIHINGMEGAYTNVLIDGLPVIGGIASIYGFTGISSSIIESIEISRYPGSVLYGIDNIGGTINIITKKPSSNKLQTDVEFYTSSYLDNTMNVSMHKKFRNYGFINSINLLWYDKIVDTNKDFFTDVTLQKQLSAFHKSSYTFKDSSALQWLFRTLWEDRWGGQINWTKAFSGSDSIYGESIITKRIEYIANYSKPFKKLKLENAISYNYHHQDSYYGTLYFAAQQHNFYYQSYIKAKSKNMDYLEGITFRYLYYKDNTEIFNNSTPYSIWLVPGIFSENTITFSQKFKSILAIRYDYHNIHKHILTPRIASMFSNTSKTIVLRNGITTGFRPVQLFTEDHAALTGSRKIVIEEKLKPERSIAGYIAVQMNLLNNSHIKLSTDINSWYIYFSNRIIPDYNHPDKIIYYNLKRNEYSINRGISFQIQTVIKSFFQSLLGFSLLDNYVTQNNFKKRLMLSEPWSANAIIRLLLNKFKVEYTANIYGKMHLPKASELDPRPDQSPVYSVQNIQISYNFKKIDLTFGIKNLLNFTPDKGIPFLIARTHDPFDKYVQFDNNGNPLPTSENPYALTFDPTYTYASMQKRRVFINVSFHF
ncbi:MAG: hypothetical protein KatS3mg027_0246 [Bacteroidia bacterium]|nr:MAG: hypothetical protein KatS3mg027_0246 [Bacteroidia bacterium]